MTRALPRNPDLDQYRRQAKDLVRAHGSGDAAALARIRSHHPKLLGAPPSAVREAVFALADAQLVLARELGFPSWARLKRHVEKLAAGEIRPLRDVDFYWYADEAGRIVSRVREGGAAARDAARRWHPELANATDEELATRDFGIADGRTIVAREHGFPAWSEFVRHLDAIGRGPHEFDESDRESDDGRLFADAARTIQHGTAADLDRFLQAFPQLVGSRDTEGRTLLLLAAQERSVSHCQILLAAGADPNVAENNGWTPLHQAAYGEPPEPESEGQRRSLEVMEALLGAGADPTAESRGRGGTPLLQALFWGHRSLADRIAREAIVPANLRTAAGLGRLDLVQGFFEDDGSLRAEAGHAREYAAPHAGFPDFTPREDPAEILADALVYASINGHLHVVDALLDRGADPNAAPYQETPLFAAVRRNHAHVARRLLERGADVNGRGSWASMTGHTALHHVVSLSRLEMAKLLVEAGADLEARDDVENSTPAGWASFFQNEDIARVLSEAAAST